MKTCYKYLILLSTLFVVMGCQKESDAPAPAPKTGIEMVAVGSIIFGNVVIGEYKEASVRLYNYGPEVIADFLPTLVPPFSVSRVTAPCNTGKIPVGVTCILTIRFTPTAKGIFNDNLTILDKSQPTSGTGLDSAGLIEYSVSSWDLGTVVAGETSVKEIDVTNTGDFTVQTPKASELAGYSRTLNECGNFIAPRRTCKMKFSIYKSSLGPNTDTFTMSSPDTNTVTITVTSQVIPGPPSGSIIILNPPTSIIADSGTDTKIITVAPVRDQFQNIVQDGTEVSLIATNVQLVGPITKQTIGGVVTFNIISTNQRGDATVTLLSGGASGFARFRSISGPAVGEIIAKPYIGTVEANGVSQIDINFQAIRDQFNNVVEDGTPVYFSLKPEGTNCLAPDVPGTGAGFILGTISNTILGEVRVTITPPLVTGKAVLIAKSGTACGAYPVTYTPGGSHGTIPIASNLTGIYADPSTGISANPPEIIQASITVGPVLDQNGNIVTTNSMVNVNLSNAIGVISGTASFNIYTNAAGNATFLIQGTGVRGYITIGASRENATGSKQIWAYGDAFLRPDRPNLPSNPFKISMSYHSVLTLPNLTGNWGLIKSWNNLDLQDKNYFGDLKKQASPTLISAEMPWMTSYCLFSAGNVTYGSNCYKDDFKESSIFPSTIKIIKANSSTDPGASVVSLAFNNPRGNNVHQETPVGCYKTDGQAGSVTYGDDIFYSNATIEVCNSQTSNTLKLPNGDPNPLYNNESKPWFNGSWITNRHFDLNFSTVGFIPDLAKVLVFGGFYEKPMFGGGFSSPNNYEVKLSDRNTWATNYGLDAPFNWNALTNIEGIYGNMPEAKVAPSVTNSNNALYMFGGMILRGASFIGNQELTNYVESSASDEFSVFDGNVNKWFKLSVGADPTVIDEDEPNSPVGRYQHGMVYIPDNDSLFIAGGKTVQQEQGFTWFEPNDMWSVANISSKNNLLWKRRCFPCTFPFNAHNHPQELTPAAIDPTPLKMAYNPYLQKVFMVWSGTNNDVSNFDPLTETGLISVVHTNNYSFSAIEGPDLFDVEVNPDIGRTYFYKRKTKGQLDSELYYWDMDPGMKQFVKIETNLGGAPAKQFIRSLSLHIRGYGSVKDTLRVVQGGGGIKAMIYNHVTSAWDLVGDNTASMESTDIPAQEILITFDEAEAPKYVSADGKVSAIIFPRDLSNYAGEGYNELKVDEFYITGLF